uniref:Alpha/beta hydrolase fold n=1 Tax=Rhodopseudomonas palustris (strain BisA53) TaxID=316055 RepID=Q07KI1_RHOP5
MTSSRHERTAHACAPSPQLLQTRLGPIELIDAGHGLPIVALHGGMGGYDQSLLLAHSAITQPDARILAVSRRGYLGTPLGEHRTPEQQADLLAAMLDALGLDQAVLIAVSAGGPCALQFALRHPRRCRALVLVSCCSGHLATPPEVQRRLPLMKLLARLPLLPTLMRWQAARDLDAAAARSILDPALRARTLADAAAGPLLRALLLSTFDRMAQRLPGTLNDTAQFAALDDFSLAEVTAPVLVIHGTADRVVPFAHAERVARQAPRAELFAVEGGDHVSLFTHLDAVRARVGEFLAAPTPGCSNDASLDQAARPLASNRSSNRIDDR